MKRGNITQEGIPGVYSPDKVRQMLAEAQDQQRQGTHPTGSENDAYNTAEETTTPEISTSQRSKMETTKSQTRTETVKSQTRTETSKGQMKSDRTTASTAL
uniref:Uncharacterized protein n=1 Tax=Romanomermis culicivorax TaxID=13658 RepID=A0A915K3C5_ROMCU